jgi:hypothetical protein
MSASSETVSDRDTSRTSWPVLTQAAGLVALAVGFGLLTVWAGVVVGGLGLVVAGLVAELPRAR